MGSNGGEAENQESAHLQLLSSIIPREESERVSISHIYHHTFKGFSAFLTETEASVLSGHANVVSVFPDQILQLHTTRSWDFLEADSTIRPESILRKHHASSDVIAGIIDTGIWPESPSFSDKGLAEIPSRWKGVCMEGPDFKKSNCNRKIIGARFYNIPDELVQPNYVRGKADLTKLTGSPRDTVGHGTHTTSIAAGAPIPNASYYGLARGTARGGSPSTRVAMYKACSLQGCSGSSILKAIDDAVKDGVDIVSISIGMNTFLQPDFMNDPIAIGSFHANQNGVMVIGSAGNDGPDPYTVVNSAPWMFTVAASTIDRDFQSTVVLGNGRTFQGYSINFSNLNSSKTYPLAFGEDVAAKFTPLSEARNCEPGSLDPKKAAGKIIVCINSDPTIPRQIKKLVVEDAKAKGMILIDQAELHSPLNSGVYPVAQVGDTIGFQILKYINSTKNPTASILPTIDVSRSKPAPIVAYFSSRGPGTLTENVLKPDIMAPGVAILAAAIPDREVGSVPIGKKPSKFAINSGTSMACPHVTGAAALIKSVHQAWTPSMIKSALMTTATISNNMGKELTNSSNYSANPHEMGVGEINPIKALNPGLVYETTTEDYLRLLCYSGYKGKIIRSMSKTNFTCPKVSSEQLISSINYPSISISKLKRNGGSQTVTRTVTNVGAHNATYIAKVTVPLGLEVRVSPNNIAFNKSSSRASYEVSFYSKGANHGYNFGWVTWSGSLHTVRTVFAVNVI